MTIPNRGKQGAPLAWDQSHRLSWPAPPQATGMQLPQPCCVAVSNSTSRVSPKSAPDITRPHPSTSRGAPLL